MHKLFSLIHISCERDKMVLTERHKLTAAGQQTFYYCSLLKEPGVLCLSLSPFSWHLEYSHLNHISLSVW